MSRITYVIIALYSLHFLDFFPQKEYFSKMTYSTGGATDDSNPRMKCLLTYQHGSRGLRIHEPISQILFGLIHYYV